MSAKDTKAKKEEIIEEDIKEEEEEAVEENEIDRTKNPQQSHYDQEVELEAVERETQTDEGVAPEVDAIHTDNQVAKDANLDEKKPKSEKKKSSTKRKPQKPNKADTRSKNYKKSLEDFDKSKKYEIGEAIEVLKNISYVKFDPTVTIDIKLVRPKKGEESVRGTIKLPNPINKDLDIAVADEDMIEKIKKGNLDFDVLLATPEMMPKLAKVAKILGPKGKMPNPKDGTVVEDVEAAKKELNQVARYKADAGYNLHLTIGKLSWDKNKLIKNAQAVFAALSKYKKSSVVLSASMTPGVKLDI